MLKFIMNFAFARQRGGNAAWLFQQVHRGEYVGRRGDHRRRRRDERGDQTELRVYSVGRAGLEPATDGL
jgi:hypothetical protein